MEGKFVYKVSGGKLLKVSVDFEGCRINSVRINGDFFAHPEDGVERLESVLAGAMMEDVDSLVMGFVGNGGVVFYGVGAEDIIHAIREAVK